jgi:ATP-binding cassette subfamily C protein
MSGSILLMDSGKQDLACGQHCWIRSNQPLWLDDPDIVWLVQKGTIDLFVVAFQNGQPVGSRRFLFSCTAGEALFGFPCQPNQWRVLAVALVASYLLKLDRAELAAQAAQGDAAAIALLETWKQKLPGRSTLDRDSDLESVYAELFRQLDQSEVEAQQQDWQRVQAQDQFNQQMTVDASLGLASLLRSPTQSLPIAPMVEEMSQDLALYKAMQAVGDAIGVAIRFPPKSDRQSTEDPLEAIARASRIRLRRVLLTGDWWQQDCGALLVYLQSEQPTAPNRPAALLSVAPTRYELFDPMQGRQIPVTAELRSHLAPVAYMFYPTLPDRKISALDLLHLGLRDSANDRWTVIWTGLAGAIVSLLIPQATAILIDQAIPSGDRGLLVQLGVGLLAAIVGSTCFQLVQGYALLRLETRLDSAIQPALWDRLLNLSVPFFRQYSTGELRSRVSVINLMRRRLSGAILRTLLLSLFALLNLLLLIYYSSQLALVAGIAALLIAVVTLISGRETLRQIQPLQEMEGKDFGLIVQLIHGVAKLRVTGAEQRAFASWGNRYRQQQQRRLKVQQLNDRLTVLNQVVPVLSIAVLYANAIALAGAGLSIGQFLAFNLAFGSFLAGITNLSNAAIDGLVVLALWRLAQPILEAKPEIDGGKANPGKLSGRIELERVTFHYQTDRVPVLAEVSLHAEPGEFIAIVGPSGSGKSTLLRLLLGFETPQSGQVLYDRQNLRDLNIQAVRRQLGVLLQTSRTSTASIFENIAGSALMTIEEAWEAARRAGLADDLAAMPMGIHTIVSEGGSNLSGGQRQRLLIARALARHPKILLFDEATSFLDNRTQAIVSASLDELKITRIVIAHRLSTIQTADRIYVLEAGRIVQQGNFASLMQQPGLFAQLMQRQI